MPSMSKTLKDTTNRILEEKQMEKLEEMIKQFSDLYKKQNTRILRELHGQH